MPPVAGFDRLPAEHRAWLLQQWRRTGYGDNARLAGELAARLAADNIEETWDASTIYRWARAEKARASRIRYAAELRAATIAALPDEDPMLAERVGAYMEGRIVEALEDLDGLDEIDPVARVQTLIQAQQANTARRRALTDREKQELARSKWEADEAIRRAERDKAADQAEGAARLQGIGPEGIAALRAAIMAAL